MIKPRSVMIYGPSGSTKTSQLYHCAKYILKTTGCKVIRMIHSDPGGYAAFEDSGMIERGEVQIFNFGDRPYSLADWRKLSSGYWPRWLGPDKKLYPWCLESERMGGELYFPYEDVCMTKPEEWEKIGGYLIDGLSSTAEVLKNHCSDVEEGVGFKPAWKHTEEGFTITGLQEGHYGIVQKEIHSRFTKGFKNLPIPWIFVSALLGKGEDKQKRETTYGPQIVGNASTPTAPSWFSDCLHLDVAKYKDIACKTKPNAAGEEIESVVAWFKKHTDDNTQIPYLCKSGCSPEMMPKLLEYFPYGFVPIGYKQGLDLYFRVMDKLRKEFRDNG